MSGISKQILSKGHKVRPGGYYKKISITIHSTGNAKSTAKNEREWLDNPSNKRRASWHYVIDEKTIIQAIPDEEEAWHAGDQTGNRCSIGVEICESGDRRTTLENAAEFVAQKLKEYGWGVGKIKKHFDWTGKNCPRILIDKAYVKEGLDWNWFIQRVKFCMQGEVIQPKEMEEEEMEKRYNTLAEIPEWAKATIQKLIDKGGFGNAKNLNLTEDMIRLFVINDRAGIYQ